jgi:hypothetical protein
MVLSRWYKIINDYGARRFSYNEDVFPGIAGIADEVVGQLGLAYNAGIWQEIYIEGFYGESHHSLGFLEAIGHRRGPGPPLRPRLI